MLSLDSPIIQEMLEGWRKEVAAIKAGRPYPLNYRQKTVRPDPEPHKGTQPFKRGNLPAKGTL